MRTAVIVNHDTELVNLLSPALEQEDFRVVSIPSAEQGVALLHEEQPDLLILDAESDGLAILEHVGDLVSNVTVIMLAPYEPKADLAFRGVRAGVRVFLPKRERPFLWRRERSHRGLSAAVRRVARFVSKWGQAP